MGCKTALTYHRFDTYFTHSRDTSVTPSPHRHQTAVARKMKKVVLVILKK